MRKLILFLFLSTLSFAQIGNVTLKHFPGAPSGSCGQNQQAENDATGALYSCVSGTWTQVGGGAPSGAAGGDLGSTYPNPTVVGLNGKPIDTTQNPSIGQSLVYDGVHYAPTTIGTGVSQILYFNNTAQFGNNLWATTPDTSAEHTIATSVTAASSPHTIAEFDTVALYPGLTFLPAGDWQFDVYLQTSSGAGTQTMYVNVLKRSSGGVETQLFTTNGALQTISGNGTGVQLVSFTSVQPGFALLSDDTLAIQVVINVSATRTITLYFDGTAHYSHVHSTIGTNASTNAVTINSAAVPASVLPVTNSSGQLIDSNNGVYLASYGVKADFKYVIDASITNTSTTITCPNSDCNFTAADVGKVVFATTGDYANGVVNVPQGTILSLNNANSIVVSQAATASCTFSSNLCYLFWGTDDTAALKAAETAAFANCSPVIRAPMGIIGESAATFITPVKCTVQLQQSGNDFAGLDFGGEGQSSTKFLELPNFDFTTCTGGTGGACHFGQASTTGRLHDFTIWGGGNNLTGTTHVKDIIQIAEATYVENVGIVGWGRMSKGLIGIHIGLSPNNSGNFGMTLFNYANNGGGSVGLKLESAHAVSCFYCQIAANGGNPNTGGINVWVNSNSQFNSYTGSYGQQGNAQPSVWVDGTMNSYGDYFIWGAAFDYVVSGTSAKLAMHDADFTFGSLAGTAVVALNGANVSIENSKYSTVTNSISAQAGSKVNDLGGNIFTAPPTTAGFWHQYNGCSFSGATSVCNLGNVGGMGGHFLIGQFLWTTGTSTFTGCTDTLGLTWTQVGTTQTTGTTVDGTAFKTAVVYSSLMPSTTFDKYNDGANGATGQQDTVTCTLSGSGGGSNVVFTEWQGQDPTPLDSFADGSGNTTAISVGTVTPPNDGELVILAMAFGGAGLAPTAGTGYTMRSSAASRNIAIESANAPVAGVAQTATATMSANHDWVGRLIAFKPNLSSVYQSGSVTGTQASASNIGLTSGWDTSTITAIRGTSKKMQFTLTAAGTPGASPVLTVTYPTAFVGAQPICTLTQIAGSTGEITAPLVPTLNTASTVSWTFSGTAVAAHTYTFLQDCSAP